MKILPYILLHASLMLSVSSAAEATSRKPATIISGTPVTLPTGDTLSDTANVNYATATTIQATDYMTAAEVANVRSCANTLDVAPQVNAAILALPPTGGRVVLPDGCLRLASTISLSGKQKAQLVGSSSMGTILQPTGNFPAVEAIGAFNNDLNGLSVQNLTVLCAGMTNTNAMGIKFVYVNTGLIRDVTIKGCYHGLDLYDQYITVVDNIRVYGLGTDQNYVGVFLGPPTNPANIQPNNAIVMSNSAIQHVAQYGLELQYFAGSRFTQVESTDGVTGWKLCGVAYTNAPSQSCQFGHFDNILSDTTSGTSIDIEQGANPQPVNNLLFNNIWSGSSHSVAIYVSGLRESHMDGLHIASTDNAIALVNSTNVSISADINHYNRFNNGSYAVTISGGSNNTLRATNTQSDYSLLGYNGIREINGTNGNSIWGGLASFNPGLAFGGTSTGLSYVTRSGTYEVRGRHVRLEYYMELGTRGTSIGAATITGLPFMAAPSPSSSYGATGNAYGASGMVGIAGPIMNVAAPGSTEINLWSQDSSGIISLFSTNFSNSSVIGGSVEYLKN